MEKESTVNLFLQNLKENTLKKNSHSTLFQEHKYYTFQRVISSLSSAFREFIGDVSPLHTQTYTHAYKHIDIHCYGTGLRLPANI